MYNTVFSSQWVFDRCLESASLFIPFVVFVSVLILSLFYIYSKKLKKLRKWFLIFSFLIVPCVVFISGLLLGFSVCSAGSVWKSINPARALNDKVKKTCLIGNCPKSENEISQLDIYLYDQIVSNAKIKYSYDPTTKEYIWYVRPSKYYVGIFQKSEFSLYKIPSLLPIKHWRNVPIFEGNVELLP